MIPKYRAFDKFDKIMYDVVMLNWDSEGKLTDMHLQKGDKAYFSVYPGNIVLMQLTGYNFKGDVCAYDGDIIRIPGHEGSYNGVIEWDFSRLEWTVRFKGDFMDWNQPLRECIRVDSEYNILTEIIGNFYEHRHLLGE